MGENVDVYKLLWKIKALLSAQVFGWRVIINKVSTKDNLHK